MFGIWPSQSFMNGQQSNTFSNGPHSDINSGMTDYTTSKFGSPSQYSGFMNNERQMRAPFQNQQQMIPQRPQHSIMPQQNPYQAWMHQSQQPMAMPQSPMTGGMQTPPMMGSMQPTFDIGELIKNLSAHGWGNFQPGYQSGNNGF